MQFPVVEWAHAGAGPSQTRELFATKIRALYERKKSRDVFDMWLALAEFGLSGEDLIAAFEPYHPASLTAKSAGAICARSSATTSSATTSTRSWPAGPPATTWIVPPNWSSPRC